jgi:hypothetical protein
MLPLIIRPTINPHRHRPPNFPLRHACQAFLKTKNILTNKGITFSSAITSHDVPNAVCKTFPCLTSWTGNISFWMSLTSFRIRIFLFVKLSFFTSWKKIKISFVKHFAKILHYCQIFSRNFRVTVLARKLHPRRDYNCVATNFTPSPPIVGRTAFSDF